MRLASLFSRRQDQTSERTLTPVLGFGKLLPTREHPGMMDSTIYESHDSDLYAMYAVRCEWTFTWGGGEGLLLNDSCFGRLLEMYAIRCAV